MQSCNLSAEIIVAANEDVKNLVAAKRPRERSTSELVAFVLISISIIARVINSPECTRATFNLNFN